LCVDACPSGAIYLVYQRIPKRQLPQEELTELLSGLLLSQAARSLHSRIAAEAEKSKQPAALLAGLALSSKVLGEDCIRESGHLVPEAGRMEDLIGSALIQRLYNQNHNDNGELEQVLSVILQALQEHRDAGAQELFLCQDCGQISVAEKPVSCPNCESDRIKEY
jgi:ferredoxin